ncbi:phage portal protein [Aminicella lysinilytica]|uniref:SPP1 family phage portal protein n=1 Tax=Aminicella lysinilytica TaxID=433323 RepID=A0A4V3CRY0_9FIRM|nr:phage portal protein [Aminicella lysinilytica]TDP58492.1 SPP1 family phage portal protein [Aminicella lysinilytica]
MVFLRELLERIIDPLWGSYCEIFNYQIAKDIYTYGNAYEYVYKDEDGVVKSKGIRPEYAYPIYDDGGKYVQFVEYMIDNSNNVEYKTVYDTDKVSEYVNGTLTGEYNNPTGLPIHYTCGDLDRSGYFGASIVNDLMPIIDEIEGLLSKMSDSVSTLSLNPLGVSVGDRVDASVDKDITGAVLNIESGGEYKWATAQLDTPAISVILDNLLNQFYTIAQVPSVLYGQSNVANVSEVSLKLLFNCADNLAKKTSYELLKGFYKRLEYIGMLVNDNFNDIEISFNYNRPADDSSIISDIKTQMELGIMSRETAMRVSPYITDVQRELERELEASNQQHTGVVGN